MREQYLLFINMHENFCRPELEMEYKIKCMGYDQCSQTKKGNSIGHRTYQMIMYIKNVLFFENILRVMYVCKLGHDVNLILS